MSPALTQGPYQAQTMHKNIIVEVGNPDGNRLQALECLTDYDHLSPKSDHSPQNSEHISQK